MFRVGLYARVSTHDQQTLTLQMRTMREYAAKRDWTIAAQIKEVGCGAAERELQERLLAAARRREIDVVIVWRLDRWGRSLIDLVVTLKELAELGVGFVSLTEALDLTTPTGRAMTGLLSVFAQHRFHEYPLVLEIILDLLAELGMGICNIDSEWGTVIYSSSFFYGPAIAASFHFPVDLRKSGSR